MGVVYQVYDRERDSLVALKTLKQRDGAAIYRFKQEFRGLADISHPNLASLHELISVGNQWFFTMELVDGVDFQTYVRGSDPGGCADTIAAGDPNLAGGPDDTPRPAAPPPDFDRLHRAFRQLAEGVFALHDGGMLHRDIKPSNVMVTRSGRVVLLDFGLVTELTKGAERGTTGTNLVGTAAYMAPEQGASLPLSPASDWYSVGVILYQALTGCLPFDGPPLKVLMDKQRLIPPPPLELLPDLPTDLAQLCADLLDPDPRARPTGAAVLSRLGSQVALAQGSTTSTRSLSAPFVGRERHLRVLTEAFAATRGYHPTTVLVHGSSGMGKSLLVERFTESLTRDEGAVVLSGRCYERESVPYKALDSLIDALSRYLITLPRTEANALMPRDALAIARLFPVLRRVEAIAEAPQRKAAPDLHESRRRALKALRELLARLADRTPLVLVIDDMQWGDIDSAALLLDLLRPPDPPALLLLVCYRSEEVYRSEALRVLLGTRESDAEALRGSWDGSGSGFHHADADLVELAIDALGRDEAEELALARLGKDTPASRELAAAIARESRGNPFFVDELVRYVQAGVATEMTDLRLEDVMCARFDQLGPDARRLLEIVALAARPLPQSVARAAAELRGDKDTALAVLRAGHLVRTTGTRGGDRIETYHDRIRETVVAAMPADTIRERHQRLARALEASDRADPESLAIHLHGAGDVVRGSEFAVQAAQQAAETLAFERAAALYRFAIDGLPPEEIARLELHTRLGEALANAGRGAEAAEEYLIAAEDARAADALELKRRAAEQLLRAGYADRGLEALRDVLQVVGITMPRSPRGALASLLYHRARLRLRGFRFRERDTSQIAAEELTRIDTCWSAAAGLGMMDTISGADFQTRSLLLALQAGEPYRIARALAFEVTFVAIEGQRAWRRTQRIIARARELAERVGHPHALGLVVFSSAMADYQAGHWKSAFAGFEKCAAIWRERCTGVNYEISGAQRFAVDALHNLGEIKELCRRVPRYLRDAQRRGNLYVAADMRTGLPNLAWLATDDPEGARREAQLGIERWSRHGFHLQHYYDALARSNIDLYTGDGPAADARITGIWRQLERSFLLRVQAVRVEALFLAGRTAIAAAAATRDNRDLQRKAGRIAGKLERESTPAAPVLAGTLRAGLATLAGLPEQAAELYSTAAIGYDGTDMRLYAAIARRRCGQLVGGSEGAEMVSAADDWMASEKIVAPERMTELCAPARIP